ncbi:MAG TPA: 3-deoxy-7-phosphoheptulonate synthase [Limnochordia bacterium]|nr:3-deoxy-7-phosphoheptulonate synthase [Limnochordia bacterium]
MLAKRTSPEHRTIVQVGRRQVGGDRLTLIAGPCSVETEPQIMACAEAAAAAGVDLLRGGAYKPRTSPYAFQGLGREGLLLLAKAGKATGLPIVTEVMEPQLVDEVAEWADVLQIGARNMANFALLKAVGRLAKPILLKRGMMSTIDEWLNAAEYILAEGNDQVILCERGIRTFETHTRNTLDLSAVPAVKRLTHLPILVDPSHATGVRDYVAPMSAAAVAAGADGVVIEAHPDPENALSDGAQSLDLPGLRAWAWRMRNVERALKGAPTEAAV